MKICLLSKNFHCRKGGTEIYPYRMAIAFSRMGHAVHIVCSAEGDFARDLTQHENIFVHDIDFKEDVFRGSWRINRIVPFNELRYSFLVAKKIRHLIGECSIDLVESGDTLAEGYWYSFNKRVPLVVRLHGHHALPIDAYKTQLSEGVLRQKAMHWMEKRLIVSADGLSCVSNDFAQLARALYSMKDKEITTIYNGIDGTIFKPSDFNGRDERTVVFVGWLRESKGLGVLSEAIPAVLERLPDARFIFIGKDTKMKGAEMTWMEYLKAKVKSNNVRFIYPVESKELADHYYGKSSICIFPSLYEPGGTVAQEAMMCGCPVVATNVGGFPEFITDKVDGVLVRPKDAKALSAAIIELLLNRELRKRLGENALEKARNLFPLESVCEGTLALYQRAIESFKKGKSCSLWLKSA